MTHTATIVDLQAILQEANVLAVLDERDRELVGLKPVKQRIRETARTARKRIPDVSEAFDQAVRSVFGGKVKQVEQRALTSKVKQRESQLIARPTNNGKRPVSGREKAIASVAALMRDRMAGS